MAPAVFLYISNYSKGSYDLSYAVIIITLMIPRVPTNLITYSIGGEKAYKTGESLLATPLKTSTILMAKAFVPFIVSFVMITLSFLLIHSFIFV